MDGVNAGNMELTPKFFVFLAGLTTLSGIAELVVYPAVLTFTGKKWLSIVIDIRVLNDKKGKELVNTSVLMSCSFRVGILVEPLQLCCFHIWKLHMQPIWARDESWLIYWEYDLCQGILLLCVSGYMVCGCRLLENMKVIDDEICYRAKECKFVKNTWQQQGHHVLLWWHITVICENQF